MSGEHEHCPLCHDDMCGSKLHRKLAKVFSDMPDESFVERAREHCRCALRNTATGAWMQEALNRLERSDLFGAYGKGI